jgi:hypothetical protein
MAQMAQFEALNQMKSMADGIMVLQGVQELTSAASMIGKTVTGKQVDGLGVIRDIVSRELYGRPFSKLTSLERVEVNKEDRVVAAAGDLPNAGNEVTGQVQRVVTDAKGIPMLMVNGKVVDLFTISEVQ